MLALLLTVCLAQTDSDFSSVARFNQQCINSFTGGSTGRISGSNEFSRYANAYLDNLRSNNQQVSTNNDNQQINGWMIKACSAYQVLHSSSDPQLKQEAQSWLNDSLSKIKGFNNNPLAKSAGDLITYMKQH